MSRTVFERIEVEKTCTCPNGADHTVVETGDVEVTVGGQLRSGKSMECRDCGKKFVCVSTEEAEQEQQDETKCECPKCGALPDDMEVVSTQEMGGKTLVTYECKKCKERVQCVKPKGCACPKCHSKDPEDREEISREAYPDGKSFIVTYKCKKDGEEYSCVTQEEKPCECPDEKGPLDETSEEISREKHMQGPDGSVIWRVKYKCKKSGEEFECLQGGGGECRCPDCGSNELTEESRNENADGTSTITYICGKCGAKFECSEGEGEGLCKCPKCESNVGEEPDNFETVGEPQQMADGKLKVRYKCKRDGTEFDCVVQQGDEGDCTCPKCHSKNVRIVNSKSVMGDKQVAEMRCVDCDFTPFECNVEYDPCSCPECGTGEHLEEIGRDKVAGGEIIHYRCKKGHKKHADVCSKKIPGCVVDCVEEDEPPGEEEPSCECPSCHATKGDGLEVIAEEEIMLPGDKKAKVTHMKCTRCGFTNKDCVTGKYAGQEAVDCVTVEPDVPRCPDCGSENIIEVAREPVDEGGKRIGYDVTYKCEDCGSEWQVFEPESEDEDEGPKCPVCGSPVTMFETTEVAKGLKIGHFSCPEGHTSSCTANLDKCVLEIPLPEGEPGDGCPCKCPSCGGCDYKNIRICVSNGVCKQKVLCLSCGTEYLCEAGDICPYCCSSTNLVSMLKVDANGNPVVEGDNYVVIVYCRACKKGSAPKIPDNIPVC